MFEWKDSYSVQINSIDGQHKNLFRRAGELHQAMQAGNSKAITAKLLDSLVRYTQVHFAQEERLMQDVHYHDFAAHKAQHDELIGKVVRFQEEFRSGRAALSIQLLQFLRAW